jgi:predicted esterase
VSPAAPVGTLLYEDGAKIFPEFLDMVRRDYKPRGGRMHAAGYSNGGVTAFYVASTYPKYFWSVTGLPGLLRDSSDDNIEALESTCIDMWVGGNDAGWRDKMAKQVALFQRKGYTTRFRVMENQNHVLSLDAMDLARLFDHLEAAANGCGKGEKQ